jgi:hypothetical protein
MEVGERPPGYKALDLAKDWEFRSPAGRWETVVEVDHSAHTFFSKIWTDVTGDGFGWLLASSREIHACPPRKEGADVVVRLVDVRTKALTPRMSLVIASPKASFTWSDWEDLPAQAEYLGRGQGWQVSYRPGGVGDLVHEGYSDKLHAKRRMNAIARAYADAIGLAVGDEMGRD